MINKNIETFIGIVKAGLCGEGVSIPKDFEMDKLYILAKRHRIMGLIFNGAKVSGADEGVDAMKKLYMGAVAELSFHEKQMSCLEPLFNALFENKISFMPLKGTTLKPLYPRPELRSMGDADILIKMEEYPRVKKVLENLSFEFKSQSSNEIVWEKGNSLHLELHSALFPSYTEEFLSVFGDGWTKAVLDGTEYRYKMTLEDEFVYNFTHFTKHYKLGGIGVKHLCDLWLLSKNPSLDFAKVDREIETLDLTEFYQNIMKTLSFWFEGGEADSKVELITKTIIRSGAFGTKQTSQNAFALRLAAENGTNGEKKRFLVWMFKIFPAAKFIEHKYPFLKKQPWLLPLAWLLRWFDALFLHRGKIKTGVKAIKNTDEETSLRIEKEFLEVGLKFNHTEE